MRAMTSQITDVSVVFSTVCSGSDQRKYQSSTSLVFVRGIHRWPVDPPHKGPITQKKFPFGDIIIITRVSEVIMFSPCVFVCLFVCVCLCLSQCLSGRCNFERLVPHKQYFTGTLLRMPRCASYVSRTHDVIDNVTRSESRSNFEIDISPLIFELERRSKAQNVGNANGYLSGIFKFQYHFR